MRLVALALLAACGGNSASTSPTTTPSGPSVAQGSEDWRAVLAQLVGEWSVKSAAGSFNQTCRWIPDAAFVACKQPGTQTSIYGYDELNRRYSLWVVDADKLVQYSGPGGANDWSLQGEGATVTLHKNSPTSWTQKTATGTATDVLELTASAPPAPPPAPRAVTTPLTVDWKSALQPLVGMWSVEMKTASGEQFTFDEKCDWVIGTTYLCCRPDKDYSFIGWEMHNQRFAHISFGEDGTPEVREAVYDAGNWKVLSDRSTVTMNRVSPTTFSYTVQKKDGSIGVDGFWKAKME